MNTFFNVLQIVISVALVLVITLQVKGGGLGGIFGGGGESVFRTKRGVERRLYQMTIALVIIFVIISIVSLKVA